MSAEPTHAGGAFEERPVWSLPLRLFHWALAASVAGGWYLGEFRSFSTIGLHFYFGYAVLALVGFRLVWGLFGPEHERLKKLVPSLRELRLYLRGILRRQPSGTAGHNPLGKLSVLALLGALTVQASTGLFAEDDSLFSEGPFAGAVESSTRITLTAIHGWSSRVILLLVLLHLGAILFYALWKRENLVRSMITGRKRVRRGDS